MKKILIFYFLSLCVSYGQIQDIRKGGGSSGGGTNIPGTMISSGSWSAGDIAAAADTTGTNFVKATAANVAASLSGAVITASAYDSTLGTLSPVDAGVTLDFASAARNCSITLTGNVTFATANLSAGKRFELTIIGCSTNSLITWPAGWHWYPVSLTNALASKWHKFTIGSRSTTDANVEAAGAQEQ